MCKWNKWGDTRIDPCMRRICIMLNLNGLKTLSCCCGHKKYHITIIVKSGKFNREIFSGITIDRKKRFYKRDRKEVYFIPEVEEYWKNSNK